MTSADRLRAGELRKGVEVSVTNKQYQRMLQDAGASHVKRHGGHVISNLYRITMYIVSLKFGVSAPRAFLAYSKFDAPWLRFAKSQINSLWTQV